MCCVWSLGVMAQSPAEKKQAELAKLELSVKNARSKVDLLDQKIERSDSLTDEGFTMVADSKVALKELAARRKGLEKEYATQSKPLSKLVTSKDKAVAMQAKADLKALDLQHKANLKQLDAEVKAATKMQTTGSTHIAKGKADKKTAQGSIKAAQGALAAAESKRDTALGVAPQGKGKKK